MDIMNEKTEELQGEKEVVLISLVIFMAEMYSLL